MKTWRYGSFLDSAAVESHGLCEYIPLEDIICQLARGVVRTTKEPCWITITLSKVCASYITSTLKINIYQGDLFDDDDDDDDDDIPES